MLTVPQVFKQNRQYVTEDGRGRDWFLVQVKSPATGNQFLDYARFDVTHALAHLTEKLNENDLDRWRVVDWITREEIEIWLPEITEPYLAANGHRMQTAAAWWDKETGAARGWSYNAWCVDSCGACADGEPLPDW